MLPLGSETFLPRMEGVSARLGLAGKGNKLILCHKLTFK